MSTDPRPLLVVDAGAAIATSRVDRFDVIARSWRLVAPALLWSETSSVLHREIRRFGLDPVQQRLVFERIRTAPIERVELSARDAPWDIAEMLGWSKTYDAEYLDVARNLGASIFSIDRSLCHGAQRLGIGLVTPA